jgi:hypothetical protein
MNSTGSSGKIPFSFLPLIFFPAYKTAAGVSPRRLKISVFSICQKQFFKCVCRNIFCQRKPEQNGGFLRRE